MIAKSPTGRLGVSLVVPGSFGAPVIMAVLWLVPLHEKRLSSILIYQLSCTRGHSLQQQSSCE